MRANYVIAAGSNPATVAARVSALGCTGVAVGDPTGGLVTVFPSVAVMSTTSPAAAVPTIIADNTGQATAAAVTTAVNAMTTAESSIVTNQATILANIKTRQATIQAWMTANPTGAVLTAAQTLVLAQMMNGLCNLLLQEFSSTAGT